MSTLGILALVCVVALLIAWLVNALVSIMSGEHPRDTGRLWSDIVLRIFAVKEFGAVGRLLTHIATGGWPLRVLYALGAIGIVALLIRGCYE